MAAPVTSTTPAAPSSLPEHESDSLDGGAGEHVLDSQTEHPEEFDLEPAESRPAVTYTDLENKRPMWSNPCGWTDSDMESEAEEDAAAPSVAEVVENPLLSVKTALRHARQFSEKFVQDAFRQSFAQHSHEVSHIGDYHWLVTDGVLSRDFNLEKCANVFQDLDLNSTVKDMYLAVQKVAIGMEQSLLDQVIYNEGHQNEFQKIESNLRSVLCSLQEAMFFLKAHPHPDAERQLMSTQYRDLRDASARNQRDFLILRKYLQLLECMEQVLLFYRNHGTSPSLDNGPDSSS